MNGTVGQLNEMKERDCIFIKYIWERDSGTAQWNEREWDSTCIKYIVNGTVGHLNEMKESETVEGENIFYNDTAEVS